MATHDATEEAWAHPEVAARTISVRTGDCPIGDDAPPGPSLVMMDLESYLGESPDVPPDPWRGPHQRPARTAPQILIYDISRGREVGFANCGEIHRARQEGRTRVPVLVHNAPSFEEGLLSVLRSEIPLRGRPVREVAMMLNEFACLYAARHPGEDPFEVLNVPRQALDVVATILNLDPQVDLLLKSSALTETAAVTLGTIRYKRIQKKLCKEAIRKRWSLPRLQFEIINDCESLSDQARTLLTWASIPGEDGQLVRKYDYPMHPEDIDTDNAKDGGTR